MKAFCLNKISKVAIDNLKNPDTVVDKIEDADSILVRSQQMIDMDLGDNILAVARAGAGVNNIPLEKYANKGVVVFNTPGANANAVKELVIAGLLLSSRDIIGGNKWIDENKNDPDIAKTAEKAKAKFAGNELLGKNIAVIGLGAIGVKVANACLSLGMNVKGYDNFLAINNAMELNRNINYVEKIEEAVKDCDFITIHVPLLDSTRGMIDKKLISNLKDGAVILNFARDTLVNEDDLKEALENGKIKKYVTDFVNASVVTFPNTIILPHLGASTEEAEDNCAIMAVNELKDYLENGNITHSVNYPDLNAGMKVGTRITIHHKNIPGMIAEFTALIKGEGGNIINFTSKAKGDFAYSVLDVEGKFNENEIKDIDGVLRVRVL